MRLPELRRFSAAAAIAAVALLTRPCTASSLGYEIWLAGKIVSIDARHALVVIAHGPTETANAGVETCSLKARALHRVRVGMDVEAQVDTRSRPWKVLHLRIYERLIRHTREPIVALATGAKG